MVECHGSLEAPSGPVPGGGEVVPERLEGPDRVLQYVLEVLLENVQGPGCIFVYGLGPVVIFCVLSLDPSMFKKKKKKLVCSSFLIY
jgi:hypothetical protein